MEKGESGEAAPIFLVDEIKPESAGYPRRLWFGLKPPTPRRGGEKFCTLGVKNQQLQPLHHPGDAYPDESG